MNHDSVSDVALLSAADAGDPVAFRALYDRYAEQIRRYHLRRTHDEEVAYDLLAETFAQAWCVRRRFRDEAEGCIGPWLFGIAHNVLRQSVRARRLEDRARERLGMLEGVDRPEATPEQDWLTGAEELLDTLPASQREAVRLRVIDELSYDRIASRMQISPGGARLRVHRALHTMRQRVPTSGAMR